MSDFQIENGVLIAYHGPGGKISIPEEVTVIGDNAFAGCHSLTEVNIPDSVREIGDRAFSRCTRLRDITVPGSVERIGEMAFHFCIHLVLVILEKGIRELGDLVFMDCRELTYVSLPDSLVSLGSKAFYGCERMLRVMIPSGITEIKYQTFTNCRALNNVFLPETVTTIEEQAFYGCWGMKHIELPARVTEIRHQTFGYCMALQSISFPPKLERIGDTAFLACKALTDLTLPESLRQIDSNAFHGCLNLTSVNIPNSVMKIGGFAFSGCTGLTRATYSDRIENTNVFSGCTGLREFVPSARSRCYTVVDGVILSRDGQKLIAYPPGRCCVRYDIPETVTEVSPWAFSEAPVKVIYVPESVKTFSRAATDGAKEEDPFVATACAEFMPFLDKPIFLGPPEALPPRHQKRVVEGFLVARQIGMPEIEPWKENYTEYIRQTYRTCEKKAWNNELMLRFLMEQGMLRTEAAELMLQKYDAAERPQLTAELTAYLEKHSENDTHVPS
ncbi:MAG: leucine-rich repeat domain-containing protein [Firmicutes bacterium]|nr:leucine-rich repeat domain-containing protein [Bacillota bacterium]